MSDVCWISYLDSGKGRSVVHGPRECQDCRHVCKARRGAILLRGTCPLELAWIKVVVVCIIYWLVVRHRFHFNNLIGMILNRFMYICNSLEFEEMKVCNKWEHPCQPNNFNIKYPLEATSVTNSTGTTHVTCLSLLLFPPCMFCVP